MAFTSALVAGFANLMRGRGEWTPVVLRPGDLAPEFELPGSDGRTYRLSEFAGREPVVLAWFPRAFTSGCTTECRSLAASRDALSRSGARWFAVSVDRPEVNRAFAESLGLDFPVLSDPDRRIARAYGVLGPLGYAARWTFYIGRDGHIVDIDKDVRPSSHGHDVAARLTSQAGPRRQAGAET